MRSHRHPLWADAGRSHGPPATEAALRGFERRTGLVLPPALCAALQVSNGGRLRRSHLAGVQPTARWKRGLNLHNLGGVGYEEGLDWSPTLVEEWGFPAPSLVLCHGGPWAMLLDYRRCGPEGDPPVVFCDTDHEVDGRPLEWTLAPSFAVLEAELRYVASRTQLAVEGDHERGVILDALRAAGAKGLAREDYEGGHTLALVGPNSIEAGPARLRAVPNRRPDGTWNFSDLPRCSWIVESTVAPAELETHLAQLEACLPGPAILLHKVETVFSSSRGF